LLLVLSTVSAQQQCMPCKLAVTSAKTELIDKGGINGVEKAFAEMCTKIAGEKICTPLLLSYSDFFLSAGVDRIFDPDWFCWKAELCTSPVYKPASPTAWAEKALAGKPADKIPSNKSKNKINFTHLTDMFVDQTYVEGSDSNCNDRICCRTGTPSSSSDAAGMYGNFNCDLPLTTVSLALEKIGSTQNNFVVWTGNTVSHSVQNSSQAKSLSTITAVTQIVQTNMKNVPVYPTIGPMDCFPPGQFNFIRGDPMAASLNTLWKNWIPTNAQTTFKLYGYYTTLHPGTKLRIVALNTLACYRYNTNLLASPEDPGNQLSWLNSTLITAERNGEGVIIIGSIAPADTSCSTNWSYRYSALIDRFSNTIRAQIFGNSQTDEMHVTRGPFSNKAVGVQWQSPSLSSFKDLNPSYRIYELDADSYLLRNFYQYRLDLVKANSVPGTAFKLIYNFEDFYLSNGMQPKAIDFWLNTLKRSELRFLKYLSNFYAGGPKTPTSCGLDCQDDLYCSMRYGTDDSIRECQDLLPSPSQFLADMLIGNWTEAVAK